MEFGKKLQELRNRQGLTQEQLAQRIFVSRTAVSKWESGRGTPSIDSLKRISELFSVTIDELLSSEELLTFTEGKQKRFCDLVFGLLDISVLMFFFLPLFAQKAGGKVMAVSLLAVDSTLPCLKMLYFVCVGLIVLIGVLTLALQDFKNAVWVKTQRAVSLALSVFTVFLFTLGLHPYAASLLFALSVIKVLLLIKK